MVYQSAAAVGRRFVSDAEATRDDILFLAEALMKSGEATAAKVVLEKARLKHPDDVKLRILIGRGKHIRNGRSKNENTYVRRAPEVLAGSRELNGGRKSADWELRPPLCGNAANVQKGDIRQR